MEYTYNNDYHNTEYVSRKSPEELEAITERVWASRATPADKAFVRRMHDALCGSDTCTCGDLFGRRGD
jgi:hypothetical protein